MVNTCLRTHKQAQDSWADQGSISCPEQTGSPNLRPLRLPSVVILDYLHTLSGWWDSG